jgi:hypothetical protein
LFLKIFYQIAVFPGRKVAGFRIDQGYARVESWNQVAGGWSRQDIPDPLRISGEFKLQ